MLLSVLPLLFLFCAVGEVAAQTKPANLCPCMSDGTTMQGGRGMGMAMGYDRSREVTLAGTVEEIQSHQGMGGMNGVHLMLNAGSERITVLVGPARWLADNKYELAVGDRISVIGIRTTAGGGDVLLARQIAKGTSTFTVRDESGRPMWRGQMGGRWRR